MCYLHGVRGVRVVKDEGLLDLLMYRLQVVDFRCVRDDALLVSLQVLQLFFQSAMHFDGLCTNFLSAAEVGGWICTLLLRSYAKLQNKPKFNDQREMKDPTYKITIVGHI